MKANPKSVKRKLAIAKGQLEGIIKMVDNDAYCIDISNQILAVIALLRNANTEIISAHLSHCVKEAKDDDLDTKIKEVTNLLTRLN